MNALLQASRLAQRREGSSKRILTGTTSRQNEPHTNPGLLFLNSEDLQIVSKHRRQTAGPIPQSWSKEIVDVKKASEARRSRRNTRLSTPSSLQGTLRQTAFQPSSLRDECIKRFLINMASDGPLLDEVAFLPMHIKMLIFDLAPKVAPINDASLDALLLEPEDIANELRTQEEEDAEDWESSNNFDDLVPERRMDRLNLSRSHISLATFRQVMLIETVIPKTLGASEPTLRLPTLRCLDLSSSSLAINAGLLAVLSHAALHRLSLANLACNLYLPLQSIALAVPSLEYLDVSDSEWLEWSHITKLDWKSLLTRLATLKIAGCEGLSPNASFLDPEGKSGGPAIVMQATSAVREAGRVKWLDIIA